MGVTKLDASGSVLGSGYYQGDEMTSFERPYDITADGSYLYICGFKYEYGTSVNRWRVERRNLSDCKLAAEGFSGGTGEILYTENYQSEARSIAVNGKYIYVGGFDASSFTENRWRLAKYDKETGEAADDFGTSGVIAVNINDPDVEVSGVSESVYDIAVEGPYIYIVGTDFSEDDVRWRIEKRYKSTGSFDLK